MRVSNYYGKSTGGYLFRVTATKAYDSYEPNDSVLTARSISAGKQIEAAIMDGKDQDFFRIAASDTSDKIEVKLTNASTTLRPRVDVFDSSKSQIGQRHSTTGGSDLAYSLSARPGTVFYVRVGDYYGNAGGNYKLIISLPK